MPHSTQGFRKAEPLENIPTDLYLEAAPLVLYLLNGSGLMAVPRNFAAVAAFADSHNIKWSFSDDVKTGCYHGGPNYSEIFLHESLRDDLEFAMQVLVHEIGHLFAHRLLKPRQRENKVDADTFREVVAQLTDLAFGIYAE